MLYLRQAGQFRSPLAQQLGKSSYPVNVRVPQKHPFRLGGFRRDTPEANSNEFPKLFGGDEPRADWVSMLFGHNFGLYHSVLGANWGAQGAPAKVAHARFSRAQSAVNENTLSLFRSRCPKWPLPGMI